MLTFLKKIFWWWVHRLCIFFSPDMLSDSGFLSRQNQSFGATVNWRKHCTDIYIGSYWSLVCKQCIFHWDKKIFVNKKIWISPHCSALNCTWCYSPTLKKNADCIAPGLKSRILLAVRVLWLLRRRTELGVIMSRRKKRTTDMIKFWDPFPLVTFVNNIQSDHFVIGPL